MRRGEHRVRDTGASPAPGESWEQCGHSVVPSPAAHREEAQAGTGTPLPTGPRLGWL